MHRVTHRRSSRERGRYSVKSAPKPLVLGAAEPPEQPVGVGRG